MTIGVESSAHMLSGNEHLRIWLPSRNNGVVHPGLSVHRVESGFAMPKYVPCGNKMTPPQCSICPRHLPLVDVRLLPAWHHPRRQELVVLVEAEAYRSLSALGPVIDGYDYVDVRAVMRSNGWSVPTMTLKQASPLPNTPAKPSSRLLEQLGGTASTDEWRSAHWWASHRPLRPVH